MAAIPQKVSDFLLAMDEMSDPRTMSWFFVPSPIPLFLVTALYLSFVKFGPRWMAKREPFNLKLIIIMYNFALVILSAWMFKEFIAAALLRPGFNRICQVIDYSDDPVAVRLANVIWWYYFSKVIEYLETVIFILRKKNQQVSFLHVYHHVSMPMLWYVGIRYLAGGASYFSAMTNSLVHVLMYIYYFLSAFGPRMQPFLWWKRYITVIQLMQFCIVMLHTTLAFYTNCGYPRTFMVMLLFYCISLMILFANFFYKSYITKMKTAKRKEVSELHQTKNHTKKPSVGLLQNGVVRRVL